MHLFINKIIYILSGITANVQVIEHGFMSASALIKIYLPFSIRGLWMIMSEHMDIELGFTFLHCRNYSNPL